jgi:hypothetical protein
MSVIGPNPIGHHTAPLGTPLNILAAKNMSYNIGGNYDAVGKAKPIEHVELKKLGANRHYVRGDGSCWARATWQCALSQILDNEEAFKKFIKQVAEPKRGYKIPEQRAKEVIHILSQLKTIFDKNRRIEYLNHANIDDSLVFFMRHVAAEYMKNENYATGYGINLEEIKTNKNKYGGPEVIAFMRYFDLEVHYIRKSAANGIWLYNHTLTNGTTEVISLNESNPRLPRALNCIFSASEIHYEFISFNEEASLTNQIANYIETDYKLALELQKKFDKEKKLEDDACQEDGRKTELELSLRQINECNAPETTSKPKVETSQGKSLNEIDAVVTSARSTEKFSRLRKFLARLFHHTFKRDGKEYVLDFSSRIKARKIFKAQNQKVGFFAFVADKVQAYINKSGII